MSFYANELQAYMAKGGKMLITGQDIGWWDWALSNYYGASFDQVDFFGAQYVQDSIYRGNQPPVPALKGVNTYSDYLDGQFYDINPGGDGSGDNLSVDEIQAMNFGDANAQATLTSQPVFTQMQDGTLGSSMSSEPTILSGTFLDLIAKGGYSNGIRYYRWDFGDGTPISYGAASINHTYTKVGTYQAYVEVGDGFGPKRSTVPYP
jgi:hypothetical protein